VSLFLTLSRKESVARLLTSHNPKKYIEILPFPLFHFVTRSSLESVPLPLLSDLRDKKKWNDGGRGK
jgi:L-cystine uptake protein TcyP (sodium:dicarboxylate symporter family)